MHDIPIVDGKLWFDAQFIDNQEADKLFDSLLRQIEWEQKEILMFGKKVLQPRLHAWYGDEGISYSYSGLEMKAKAWNSELMELKNKIETTYPARYNSVLLNLYRDGNDSMGWHSDDEKELGKNPSIASLSLGATRRFHLKHKKNKNLEALRLDLQSGSLLVMAGSTQECWKHQVSKTAQAVGPRINLTFRYIYC